MSKLEKEVKLIFIDNVRKDFPFTEQTLNKKEVIYFDSAASSQKPQVVIDSMVDSYSKNYSNIHRGMYSTSIATTNKYEGCRETVRSFISAKHTDEIIFTKGTTESINFVANSLMKNYFLPNDEIIITQMEHHSNIVPWQMQVDRGIKLKYIPVKPNGDLDLKVFLNLINKKTKMLSLVHCSNVLGTINPVKKIIEIAKEYKIPVLLDGAQSISHQIIDVQVLGCDFFVFSSHKMYGPTGVGVLYAKRKWHDIMTPYQGGGNMVQEVTMEKTTFAKVPYKFEAGTPDIVGVFGLAKAIEYILSLNLESIVKYEDMLLEVATRLLKKIPDLRILGNNENKSSIISFVIDGLHPNDLGNLLSLSGICVRTGHHCAQPLLRALGHNSALRVSLALYNTVHEIEFFIQELHQVIKMLR